MRRFFAAFLAVCMMVFLGGCSAPLQEGVHLESGAALEKAAASLESFSTGTLRRYSLSDGDLFSLLSATCQEASFAPNALGAPSVLFRERLPVVFLFWPAYDYYDGRNYYYEHEGTWFIDGFGRFLERTDPKAYFSAFEEIRNASLAQNDVYTVPGGFRLVLVGLDAENHALRLELYTDEENTPLYYAFSSVPPDGEGVRYEIVLFSDVNDPELRNEQPKSLNLADVAYMTA